MEWFLWMLAVAILGLGAVAASGRLGELPPTVTSNYVPHPPEGDLDAAGLRAVKFSVAARGYAMDQVDDLLERLARQLDRDASRPARALSPTPAAAAQTEAQPPRRAAAAPEDPIPGAEPEVDDV